jgi:hypothetical protein
VAGCNDLPSKYESDHTRHPQRVMLGTESYPTPLHTGRSWKSILM